MIGRPWVRWSKNVGALTSTTCHLPLQQNLNTCRCSVCCGQKNRRRRRGAFHPSQADFCNGMPKTPSLGEQAPLCNTSRDHTDYYVRLEWKELISFAWLLYCLYINQGMDRCWGRQSFQCDVSWRIHQSAYLLWACFFSLTACAKYCTERNVTHMKLSRMHACRNPYGRATSQVEQQCIKDW